MGGPTRAITLHQPWASLIALGVKRIQTRSWPAPPALIGQRLSIHAAARLPQTGEHWTIRPDATGELICHLHEPWTEEEQVAAGHSPDGNLHGFPVPLGAIVASCTLTACVPMAEVGGRLPESFQRGDSFLSVDNTNPPGFPLPGQSQRDLHLMTDVGGDDPRWEDLSDQRPYGDFASGRWAWILEDIKPTTDHCPWCDGMGTEIRHQQHGADGHEYEIEDACRVCSGNGMCVPVPAKGAQRIWRWEP